MPSTLRRLLVGRTDTRGRWLFSALSTLSLFAATFAAYAVGVFEIAGGVVFVPGQAVLVGLLAAATVGYGRGGLIPAWAVAYGSLLGYHADHAFLGLSYRPLVGRLAYFVNPEGLAVFAVQAVVLGTLAFAVGRALGRGVDALRRRTAALGVE